jgi:chorismate mutase
VSGAEDTVAALRERIAAQDRALLAAVNERLRLVAELKRWKADHGLAFLDPERERRLVEALAAANEGPLSEEGLRELFAAVLDLTKRELG